MGKAKKPSRKYCMVPECKNSSKKTPDKVFFRIPSDVKVRKQWCKMMRRQNVSPISCLYCCEDHFNVKEDTSNYLKHKLLKEQGEKCRLRLKKGVVPHIFLCQKRNMPPPVRRMGAKTRQRLVNEALSEYALKSGNDSKSNESLQSSNNKANPIVFVKVCDILQAGASSSCVEVSDNQGAPSKSQSHKAVQVNIKPKYRSKGVNVNIQTINENFALSSFPHSSHNNGTSSIKLSVSKQKLFTDNAINGISISSYSSMTSADYEPGSAFKLSPVQDESEEEKDFKIEIFNSTLTATEEEPKMLLGLP